MSRAGRDLYLQEPVDGHDERDVFGGQSESVEDHHHGDDSSLWESGSADAGRRGRDADGHHVAHRQLDTAHLRDENGRHSLVECRAVHVDGGADGHDETGHARIHPVLFFQAGESHRKGGRTGVEQKKKKKRSFHEEMGDGNRWNAPGGCGKSGGEGLGEVADVAEGQLASDDKVDELEDDESVDEESDHDGEKVHAQLAQHHLPALHFEHLGGDQESDTDGREPNDEARDLHDGLAQRDEKIEEGLAFGAHPADGDAQHDGEDHQAEDIGRIFPIGRHFPVVQVFCPKS